MMRRMPNEGGRALEQRLADFVAAHRGVELRPLFGRPAAYAGRRIFARIVEGAIWLKLPASARDAVHARRANNTRTKRSSASAAWVELSSRDKTSMARLDAWLELAARHAAQSIVPAASGDAH